MEVYIDDIKYVPMPEQHEDKTLLAALEVRFNSDAGDNIRVRDYLHKLLDILWEKKESFSGKRPFGNSGWEYDLFHVLVKEGFIKGEYEEDEEGYVQECNFDEDEAHQYVFKLIDAIFDGIKE